MINIQLRYYKRFDADLIALQESGIRLSPLVKKALIGYAHGEKVQFFVPYCLPHDLNDRQVLHSSLNIEDPETEKLIRSVKYGYRNAFCKLLLRNALVVQSFGVFFSDNDYIVREQQALNSRIGEMDSTVTICRPSHEQISYAEQILGPGLYKKRIRRASSGNGLESIKLKEEFKNKKKAPARKQEPLPAMTKKKSSDDRPTGAEPTARQEKMPKNNLVPDAQSTFMDTFASMINF